MTASPQTTQNMSDDTDRYRWLVMAVVLIGTLMVTLDTTIVNIALPRIRADLHAGTGIEWVVTSYLLAVAASQPATGWLADRFGRRRVFLWSLAAFTAASLSAALAPNLAALIGFRILQGFGGGALVPVGMAIVVELFPAERRGRAMSVWGVASMAAPAIGPTLGGYLVTEVNWHWLFLINVPMGSLGLFLGLRLLRDSGYRNNRRLDTLGLLLGGIGLAVTLFAVTKANDWGWVGGRTLLVGGIGVAMLIGFGVHERRCDEPMIDLAIFQQRVFSLAMIITLFITAAQYTRLVFVPLELETVRGYTAFHVGLLLTPQALITAVGMMIGGNLVDRIGARLPVMIGAGMMCLAAVSISRIGLHTSPVLIVAALCLQGGGFGLCAMPTTVVAMNTLPPHWVAQGAALRSLNSQVSGAIAISVLSALVAARMGGGHPSLTHQQGAYDSAFLVVSIGLFVACVFAFFLPGRAVRRAHDRAEDAALLLD